jgi:hypothetical protein
MESLTYKIKISVLWISFAVCSSAAMIIWFIQPGILDQIITKGELANQKLSEGIAILFSLWWLLTLGMAFLTHIFKYKLNRILNMVLGLFWALVTVYDIITNIVSGWFQASIFIILIFMLIVAGMITYYAWNLPREEI